MEKIRKENLEKLAKIKDEVVFMKVYEEIKNNTLYKYLAKNKGLKGVKRSRTMPIMTWQNEIHSVDLYLRISDLDEVDYFERLNLTDATVRIFKDFDKALFEFLKDVGHYKYLDEKK